MAWLLLGMLGGLAVTGVAAWARGSRRRAEAEDAARRARSQLQADEKLLLARLNASKDHQAGP